MSNGPPAQYTYTKLPSGTTTVPQSTNGTWVFTANGAATPFNDKHMSVASGGHIVPNSPFTISPSNVLRTMPFGMPGSNSNANAEVLSINGVVRSLLDPNDLRRNYFHEGTTWSIFGASPNSGNQVGTNKLENTTMETFNQGGNCFSCHSSNSTAVSHVFDDTAPLF